MAYLLDGLLVALFVLCVYVGWRRGFIKTISGLIALAAAVLVSTALCGPIADLVYTNAVEPTVVETLEAQLTAETLPESAEIDMALEKLPAFVTGLLEAGEVGNGEAILGKMETLAAGETAARAMMDRVITPIVLPLLEMLCSVLLFILVYCIATIVLRVLGLVAKLPVLKQLNNLLGVVAGALTGAVWVIFAARILFTLAWLGLAAWLTPAVLEQTHLVSFANALLPTFGA